MVGPLGLPVLPVQWRLPDQRDPPPLALQRALQRRHGREDPVALWDPVFLLWSAPGAPGHH